MKLLQLLNWCNLYQHSVLVQLLLSAVLQLQLISASPTPQQRQHSTLTNTSDCAKICDSRNLDNFFPQECSKKCKGHDDGLSFSSRSDNTRLEELEKTVSVLETRTDSLLIVVIFLFVVVLLLIPVIIYRTTLINYFFPICCSSNYVNRNKTVVSSNTNSNKKKRRGGGGGGGNSRRHNAPTDRPGQEGGRLSSTDGGSPVSSTQDTVIVNGKAVTMTGLENAQNASMIANPGSRQTSPTGPSTLRARHPSESSCTAEANNISFSDPNCSCDQQACTHAYYNYGCSSTSTIAVSPSQSRTSRTSMPLNASALLNQRQAKPKEALSDGHLDTSTEASTSGSPITNKVVPNSNRRNSSNDSPPITPHQRTPSLPNHRRLSGFFSNRGGGTSQRSQARRPSTPETILSNATVETTLSCATLRSDM